MLTHMPAHSDSRRPVTRAFRRESPLCLAGLIAVVVFFGSFMGYAHFFSTLMRTSYDLLINTVFYIMAISVLAGAFGGFLAEFGVLALLNLLLAPAARRIWGMPGVAAIVAMSTFLSDNPAVSTLGRDPEFIRYFSPRQRAALTNFGTSFGMGMIVTTFCMARGFYREAVIGLLGATIGSLFATRTMLWEAGRRLPVTEPTEAPAASTPPAAPAAPDLPRDPFLDRFLKAILDGGRNGLETSFQMIPGVLVICTMVLMLTLGRGAAGYDGSAYQGVPVFAWLARRMAPVLDVLFGFSSPGAVIFPITALGSVGAALGMMPRLLQEGVATRADVAVFAAMGICWSGFLSSHVGNMNSLGFRTLVGRAMAIQFGAGLLAGVAANLLRRLAG